MIDIIQKWLQSKSHSYLLFWGIVFMIAFISLVSLIFFHLRQKKKQKLAQEEKERSFLEIERINAIKHEELLRTYRDAEKQTPKIKKEKSKADKDETQIEKSIHLEKKRHEKLNANFEELIVEKSTETTEPVQSIQQQDIIEPEAIQFSNKAPTTERITSNPYVSDIEVETKVIESLPAPGQSEPKRIGYKPSNEFLQDNPYMYAVVKMPKPNSLIKFPRKGRSDKKGYKEDDFFIHLQNNFGEDFLVSNDKHVPTKTSRPYEPDLILSNEKDGKNIFINIEIDEPYDGWNRTPTHCLSDNDFRDEFFTNRGWIVIRFAEYQIHVEPKKCCAFIAKVISSIDPTFNSTLLNESSPNPIKQWDSLQAKKWEKEKFRENYLGIRNFGRILNTKTEFKITDSIADQECEIEVPKLNILGQDEEKALSIENSNTRDHRIKFDPKTHRYYIDDNPDTISVTQLIDRFFPEFDAAYWAPIKAAQRGILTSEILAEWEDKRNMAAISGTALHEAIENYYNGQKYEANSPEFNYFLTFKQNYINMIPFRSEWRIFDEDLLVAGTIDMVYKKENGELYMFDWKRSEKVVTSDGMPIQNSYQFASGELAHLCDSSYNKYCLQQNIYKSILEKRYGKTISSMNLLILHEKYDRFHLLKIPNMDDEVAYIMNYALRWR